MQFQNPAQRIRFARNILGLTRKDFENRFEISANTLQSWENGKNFLTEKGAKRLTSAFIQLGLLCSEDWFLYGGEDAPVLMNKNIIPTAPLTEDFCIIKEMDVFKAINPNPVVVIIADSGMEPIYEVGDYVAGNKKMGNEIKNLIGENCIIETSQGDTYVRKIIKGSNNSTYNLACLNIYSDQQPLMAEIKIKYAAKIILHRKRENLKNAF